MLGIHILPIYILQYSLARARDGHKTNETNDTLRHTDPSHNCDIVKPAGEIPLLVFSNAFWAVVSVTLCRISTSACLR